MASSSPFCLLDSNTIFFDHNAVPKTKGEVKVDKTSAAKLKQRAKASSSYNHTEVQFKTTLMHS
jgi:hypothetical protein